METREKGNEHVVPEQFETRARITRVLQMIGMPANILGYQHAREAITVAMRDRSAVNAITKILYPAVAKTYETTPSRVERNIRHAIEAVWNRGDLSTRQRFFGVTASCIKGKPTNAEFVAAIAEYLLYIDDGRYHDT